MNVTSLWLLPLLLLLITGGLLGLSTNLAKLAVDAGLSPLSFLAWSVAIASALMLTLATFRHSLPQLNKRTLKYFIISAVISFALPNLIFFSAIPHVGVSFVALAITSPPLFTYLGALILKMEGFCKWRAIGILLALGGTLYIAILKLQLPGAAVFWIIATLLAPFLLAGGNLYRSLHWPKGAKPESLAPGMMAASAFMLLIAASLPVAQFDLVIPTNGTVPFIIIVAQAITFALLYSLFFMLQKEGGPVYLSLMGSVAAIVSVPIAIFLLDDMVPPGLAIGATLITLGIISVTYGGIEAQRKKEEQSVCNA